MEQWDCLSGGSFWVVGGRFRYNSDKESGLVGAFDGGRAEDIWPRRLTCTV